MTELFFHAQMARLIGLKFVPGDMTTHWEALHDLPEDALREAVSWAGRTRVEFPTPYELRQDVDVAWSRVCLEAEDRSVSLETPVTIEVPQAKTQLRIDRGWIYHCDQCSDSGWHSLWCGADTFRKPGQTAKACGSDRTHDAHEWVEHCHCYDMNPELLRKRVAAARYAVAHTTKAKTW